MRKRLIKQDYVTYALVVCYLRLLERHVIKVNICIIRINGTLLL